MYRNNNTKNTGGFTLVEMLVSIAVFMSVMVVAVSALVSIIHVNAQTQEIKSVVDNVTFAIDSISRGARVGTNYSCDAGSGFQQDCLGNGGKIFEYQNPDQTYTEFKFVPSSDPTLISGQGNIQRIIGCTGPTVGTCPLNAQLKPNWQSMTAPTSTVNITNMTFYVIGATNATNPTASLRTQPRVIITVEGDIIGTDGKATDFTVQTTASERSRQSGN